MKHNPAETDSKKLTSFYGTTELIIMVTKSPATGASSWFITSNPYKGGGGAVFSGSKVSRA
jgi:hypothetical protein